MRRIAACLLMTWTLSLIGPGRAQTPLAAPSDTPVAEPSAPADVELGGMMILRVRAAAGGQTAQERADLLTSRLTDLLGFPGIVPADVTVYAPPGQPPAVYALGRRVLTVDAATTAAAGGGVPLMLATRWARRLQQVLPRVNYRPSNMPEPVIPPNPPLTVTDKLEQVGGGIGTVTLHGKDVFRVIGPQPGGLTAVERADALTSRLARLANRPEASSPDALKVTLVPQKAPTKRVKTGHVIQTRADVYCLTLAGTPVLTVTPDDATGAGATSAQQLAQRWAKSIQAALTPAAQPSAAMAAPSAAPTPPAPDLPPLALSPAPPPPPPPPAPSPAS